MMTNPSPDLALTLPGLSFVFPMYNELGNIEHCVAQALETGRKITPHVEIVIVDDASTDGSGALADTLAARHPEVRVLHHAKNRKLGGALRTGFAAATQPWVLYMDSDLPVDMNDTFRALPLARTADMVIGNRQGRAEGVRREVMSWGYNNLIRVLFGLNVRDINFAFKLFRRDILQHITLQSEGSFIDAELLVETHKAGYAIAELPIQYHPRVAGVSTLASSSVVVTILHELLAYRRAARKRPAPAAGAPQRGRG